MLIPSDIHFKEVEKDEFNNELIACALLEIKQVYNKEVSKYYPDHVERMKQAAIQAFLHQFYGELKPLFAEMYAIARRGCAPSEFHTLKQLYDRINAEMGLMNE